MTPTEKYYRIILGLIRENFPLFLISIALTAISDLKDIFGRDSAAPYVHEVYYIWSTFVFLFGLLITIQKYRNPLQYSPKYVLFVKDRNDSIIEMKPYLDPWVVRLGLINPKEIVNVRYSMYPDLDLGLDLDPNTGIISGYPMELGNHVSEVKMKFLGGTYSTMVRVESIETLKERMIHKRDEFAPPRTVAQLLIREEDLLKREKDLDYDMSKRQELLEDEYRSKEMGLKELFSIEKEKSKKQVDEVRKEYESQLVEMVESLQHKEREIVESEKESREKLEKQKRELEESRTLMKEFGITTQNRESEEEPEEEVVEEEPEEEPEEEVVEEEPEEEFEEEVVDEEPEEEYDYVSMTKAELVELAKERGLPVSGTKKKIIARLEEND